MAWIQAFVKGIVSLTLGGLALFGGASGHPKAMQPEVVTEPTSQTLPVVATSSVQVVEQHSVDPRIGQLQADLEQEKSARQKLEMQVQVLEESQASSSNGAAPYRAVIPPTPTVKYIPVQANTVLADGDLTNNILNIRANATLLWQSAKLEMEDCNSKAVSSFNLTPYIVKSNNTSTTSVSYGWGIDMGSILSQYPTTCLMDVSVQPANGPVVTSNKFKITDLPIQLLFK